MANPKYIFVVGGVMSGIGKGVASSAIGRIMQSKGYKTTAIKIDPYINVDAGTMNPTEHGEVFVLADGYETDQDMGNYERFLGETLPSINYMSTGRVYQEVIRRERNLEYKGKNVQVVPDVPLEVIRRIKEAQKTAGAEVVLIEVGGTIGEYENILFLEAARMLKHKFPKDVAVVMLSYLPIPGNIGEMKTKPTQHASRELNSVGLQADIILARATVPLDEKRKEKIALFCNVSPERVISAPDVDSIYDVPINYEKDGLGDTLCDVLGLERRPTDLSAWEAFVKKSKNGNKVVTIAVVGKYFKSGEYVLSDVYISVIESLKHAAYAQDLGIKIVYLDSKEFETGEKPLEELAQYDGILVPGGFGETGIEGKLSVIRYVRENKIPYFGLCYGMQLMCIEYARSVAGLAGANTAEIDKEAAHTVIDFMPEQKEKIAKGEYGGTMRLGSYPCALREGTIAREAYGVADITERHRHRYEVNPAYSAKLQDAGLVFSGTSPDGTLMEIAELPREAHPFMLGTQFHPEFLSRPLSPHPLFLAFIKAAGERG
ncbi:CTP synthase [Candidatus Adlerbacteria bacterium RIFCSPLOWO2_01_FULL_54_21b]|uniref:CTP synthase n=1 Tax=Candidatus Adlerbacteria bacterium RIFCSPLOWO2_01_FULL_54_21b TaxID=1797245 RepID=A0A1F4XXH6_9BACT|nr:MAG: CTP synthase [Candidatus Adlerbacteria bacterium RIFCSPLOWO2_01_FULL_54_21b]